MCEKKLVALFSVNAVFHWTHADVLTKVHGIGEAFSLPLGLILGTVSLSVRYLELEVFQMA
jgi:hypothetical protein